jgi:hypothetical protein
MKLVQFCKAPSPSLRGLRPDAAAPQLICALQQLTAVDAPSAFGLWAIKNGVLRSFEYVIRAPDEQDLATPSLSVVAADSWPSFRNTYTGNLLNTSAKDKSKTGQDVSASDHRTLNTKRRLCCARRSMFENNGRWCRLASCGYYGRTLCTEYHFRSTCRFEDTVSCRTAQERRWKGHI